MPGISSTCGDEDRVLMDLGREHGLGTQLGCFATSAQSNGALLRTFDGSPNLSEFACRGNRLVVRVPACAGVCLYLPYLLWSTIPLAKDTIDLMVVDSGLVTQGGAP